MNQELIKIGAIIATRGLAGEVKVFPTTDFVEDRFFKGAKLMLAQENRVKALVTVASLTQSKGLILVRFSEINSIDEAEKYLRYDIVIKKSEAVLPKGFVFDDELIGLDVFNQDHIYVGVVKEIISYTPQKTLRIKREGQSDVLIPILPVFVKSTDLDAKKIIVETIEGML